MELGLFDVMYDKWPQGASLQAVAAREALVTHFATMLELEERLQEGSDDLYNLPERRLVKLLEQAAAYQVGRSSNGHRAAAAAPAAAAAYANGSRAAASASGAKAGEASNGKGGRTEEQVTSLLQDYASPCVPNTPHLVLRGHSDGVKSVAWLRESAMLFSAGNDQTLRLWSAHDGSCLAILDGHAARIWQLAVSHLSPLVASAAADGTVRLWRVGDRRLARGDLRPDAGSVLRGRSSDVGEARGFGERTVAAARSSRRSSCCMSWLARWCVRAGSSPVALLDTLAALVVGPSAARTSRCS